MSTPLTKELAREKY